MKLTAYLSGTRVGWFTQQQNGNVSLEYDREWQRRGGRQELSLSLPKSRRLHTGDEPINYLWNLLPDNSAVLKRWGAQFGVSAANPMKLLAQLGLDAAGAIQLTDSDEHDGPELAGHGNSTDLVDADIASLLREQRSDPSLWGAPTGGHGYFSLSGAQAKFTLLKTPTGWAQPTGRTASTHIVKPGIDGRDFTDISEHLTMRAAAILGLRVAASAVEWFEDQSAIVVERFDRVVHNDGTVERQHQEDFAQIAGIHPRIKYQSEGGPGFGRMGNAIEQRFGPRYLNSIARLFDAALFNWASLSTDAHAKNYALVYGADRRTYPTLAPLYDLGTALLLGVHDREVRLAMSFDGRYKDYEIERRHILREAAKLAIPEDWAMERARHFVTGLPAVFSQAVAETPLTGDAARKAALLIDKANKRSQRLMRLLME